MKKRGRKKRKRSIESSKVDSLMPPLKVRIKPPPEWTSSNGVELLVQAAALTALSPPPPDQVNNNKPSPPDDVVEDDEGKLLIADADEDVILNTSNGSNGRDSGMANEDSDDSSI